MVSSGDPDGPQSQVFTLITTPDSRIAVRDSRLGISSLEIQLRGTLASSGGLGSWVIACWLVIKREHTSDITLPLVGYSSAISYSKQ